jgi:GTP-binding protein HflX
LAEPVSDVRKIVSQRGILVSVIPQHHVVPRERVLDEIRGLAETAGVDIVGEMVQQRQSPDVATYLGSGKVEELKQLIEATQAQIVVFDNNLSPSQGKNLEDEMKTIVVDRSEVILDIFASHARTHESRLQVELAQLLYLRPRLKRMWTHLERIVAGALGSARGPGEKQLELDRRLIDTRISELQRKLKEVEKRRERMVNTRDGLPTVSLVGYTNAGKSTLMSALTGADMYVADKLFATLDTRTRKWNMKEWGDILLSDTVGFVRDLPHHLVASFKSTLEEARSAQLLLHVVDASDPDAELQIKTVNEVLKEIEVTDIPTLLVLNKIDAQPDPSYLDVLRSHHDNTVSVSAITGEGIEQLRRKVTEILGGGLLEAEVISHVGNGKVYAYLKDHAQIHETIYEEQNVLYKVTIGHCFIRLVEKLEAHVNVLPAVLSEPST